MPNNNQHKLNKAAEI